MARIRQWIGFLIMLAGLGLLAGPFLLGAREEWVQEQAVDSFYQSVEEAQTAAPEPLTDDTLLTAHKPWNGFYEAAKAYNESLLDGQDAMTRPEDVEQFALNPEHYRFYRDVIGTIRIPRMEIELGLYLGANNENMEKGAAILGMTSFPLGESSENTAIAGHRGWRGAPMFREIQKLQIDDPIYVTTPWRTLTYRVCEIRIVTPEDTSWCEIQRDRTLISLMTCHPYGQNYQRYIVFAELSLEDMPTEEEIIRNDIQSFDPAPRTVTLVNADGTSETVMVDPSTIQPDGSEYGAVLSNFVILAEDKMRTIAWIAAVLVAFAGTWLTVMTVRDFRKT